MRKWRKYRAEIEALAESSDEETCDRSHAMSPELSTVQSPAFSDTQDAHAFIHVEHAVFSDSSFENSETMWSSDTGSETDENTEEPKCLSTDLASWAIRNKHSRISVCELLDILQRHGHHQLPKDARTLLQTPNTVHIFWYRNWSCSYFEQHKCTKTFCNENSIELLVNVDGVPLFKSSNAQFWPILATFGHFDPLLLHCILEIVNQIQSKITWRTF